MLFVTLFLLQLLVLSTFVSAKIVTYDWTVSYVSVNADGGAQRRAIGINKEWPCPAINADVGDQVVINLKNGLADEYTSLHFHGIFQQGTNDMDGPPGVTQCEIAPGESFTYSFAINQPGTYWYHSHTAGQYPDGLRGPIIVNDPKSPYRGQYDAEIVVTVADWYHDEMPGLISYYLSPQKNPDAAEPVPYSALLNEAQNIKLNVEPQKTYLLRLINMAAFSQAYVHFDQHTMTIVEADGVYTERKDVETVYLAVAQRYGVLLKTKADASKNYAMLGSLDTDRFDNIPSYLRPNVTGYLVYDEAKPLPTPPPLNDFNIIDDFSLVPYDHQSLLGNPDQTITLELNFATIQDQNRATFNNITYIGQKVPTLATALTVGKDASDPRVYGVNTNPYVLQSGKIIEVVINNLDGGAHPIHMHGHTMQLVARSSGIFVPPPKQHKTPGVVAAAAAVKYTGDTSTFPAVPMRRDTFMVAPAGYTVMRFRADNPGVWILHCHMEWHVVAGLTATMIEAPAELQKQYPDGLPAQSIANCKAQGVPTAGNAAGNTMDHFDLTGANTHVPPLNESGAVVP